MEQETDDQCTDHDQFFDQIFLNCGDGFPNQIAPIISRDHLDALRHRRLQFFEFCLQPLDDGQGILAESHDHDPACHFSLSLQFHETAPHIGTKTDHRHIP